MCKHLGLIVALGLSLASISRAAAPPLMRYTFAENHMGTQFKIVLYAPDAATAEKAQQAAFARIAKLDGIMSDYRANSELMQLCKKAGGDPVPISADLFTVLQRGQEVAQLSDGAFDMTIGPLVRLWRQTRRTGQLPSADELARAKSLVGHDKVKLDPKARTVQLTTPGMQLDLGGIAKGYAADEALKVLKQHGIDRALVAAGGDVAVSGPPPDAPGWSVAIAPLAKTEKPPTLLLRDAAVSTSGDAEQFVEIDGQRYAHIVDPKTGLGLRARLSVTVVGPNGLTVDPLTKVPAVLGTDKGLALLDKVGVAVLVVRKTDKGLETVASPKFKDVPKQNE